MIDNVKRFLNDKKTSAGKFLLQFCDLNQASVVEHLDGEPILFITHFQSLESYRDS